MAKLRIDVEITPVPELCASMFARMDSFAQAKALSMMWDAMRGACDGSAYKAAMQCAWVRESMDDEAKELVANLTEPAGEGWVMPVERKPTMSELMELRAYLARELEAQGGPPLPKTYTVVLPSTGEESTGLSADEVLELAWPDNVREDGLGWFDPAAAADLGLAAPVKRLLGTLAGNDLLG